MVLTDELDHQRGATTFREELTRSMRDEVRVAGVGPYPVRWTTTFDVVAPGDEAAFAIDDPALAAEIRQRVERIALVVPPPAVRDRRPTLDLVFHAPVPMTHDVIVRANGQERLVGAFRCLPWTRGEFRSEFESAQPWLHQLTLGTPKTWPTSSRSCAPAHRSRSCCVRIFSISRADRRARAGWASS